MASALPPSFTKFKISYAARTSSNVPAPRPWDLSGPNFLDGEWWEGWRRGKGTAVKDAVKMGRVALERVCVCFRMVCVGNGTGECGMECGQAVVVGVWEGRPWGKG